MDLGSDGSNTPQLAHQPGVNMLAMDLPEERLEQSPSPAPPRIPSHTAAPAVAPARESLLYRRIARVDMACNVVFAAAAVLSIVGVFVWHAANVPAPVSAAAAPIRAAVVAEPAMPLEAQRPPVQLTNPFDATEKFEFPAGTSASQARDAMAELLLQRARGRFAQKPILRYASLPEQAGTAAPNLPELFVNKLNGDAN